MFFLFSSLTCSVNIAPKIAPLGMWKINVGQYKRISASELREGRVQKKLFFCEIDLKLWLDRPFGLYAY